MSKCAGWIRRGGSEEDGVLVLPEAVERAVEHSGADILQAVEDIRKSVRNIPVPDWVHHEGLQTRQRLQAWRGDDSSVVFPILTDIHSGGRDTYRQIVYLNSLASMFAFDFIADLGDIGIDLPETREPLVARTFCLRHAWLHHCYPGVTLELVGNHDHNRIASEEGDWISNRELGSIFNVSMLGRSRQLVLGPDGTYGYFDVPRKEVRIVFLNSSDHSDSDAGYYAFSRAQLKFLADSLQFSNPGWTAVVLSHFCVSPLGAWLQYHSRATLGEVLMSMLEDFTMGRSGERQGVKWTFGNNCDCHLAGMLCGDSHFDAQRRENHVNVVISQGYGGIDSANLPKHGRHSPFEPKTGMLVDIVCLKPKARQMNLFRLGCGGALCDRELSW